MNILVTGGLGFIGSHLVTELLKRPEARVTVVDNLSKTVLGKDRLIHEITEGAAGSIDVRVASVSQYAPEASQHFDAIFHLASVVGPAAVLKHAGAITESVVSDCYQMIRLAQEHGARLVFVSTSEVYGGGDEGYCEEDTPRVFRGIPSARQEYAAAKMACEISIGNLCQAGELDAVIIRPFNVAGIRQQGRGGFVLPRFIGQALLGLPLTVFGDGTQLRAFTDARDVASGICLVWKRADAGTVLNVGNPANLTSIDELADCVLEAVPSSAGKTYVNPKTLYGPSYADAADKFPNADRLKQLGWKPRYALASTVGDTAAWMRRFDESDLYAISGLARAASHASAVS